LSRLVERYALDEKSVPHAAPYAVAKRIIEEEFLTALPLAGFDPYDAMLSPLGPCARSVAPRRQQP
jgi:hypothetical protein